MAAGPQQERRDLLALGAQIDHRALARTGEIAHRLVTLVRNPYRRQLTGAQKLRQAHGITPIGLDPITGLLRDQRRRNHAAAVTKTLNLPVSP